MGYEDEADIGFKASHYGAESDIGDQTLIVIIIAGDASLSTNNAPHIL